MHPPQIPDLVSEEAATVAMTRCVTCSAAYAGRFCGSCGEKRVDEHDFSISHFLTHVVEAFTHLDGNIFRSLGYLFSKPGKLTTEYLRGKRKPYVSPLQLFLIINLFFFVLQPFIRWSTLVTPLEVHLKSQFYSPMALALVRKLIIEKGLNAAEYTTEFDHITATHAKSMVIVMVPIFALGVYALFRRSRKYYVEHLIFSLHFYGFWLLTLPAVLWCTNITLTLLANNNIKPSPQLTDDVVTGMLLSIISAYMYAACREVYRQGKAITMVKAIVLAVLIMQVLQLYRCILFFSTFYWI